MLGIQSLAFVGVLLCLLNSCLAKPNIVLILADDFGYNDIGYHAVHHHSVMKTPHLDSLAMSGIRLENYYVQPVCSPSRSQLMSGRYQIHTGLQHYVIRPLQRNGVPLENILLPEQLKACGYDTHMVGKWHLGFYKEDYLPWKRGFNSYFGYLTGSEDYYTKVMCPTKEICGYDMRSEKGTTNDTYGEYSVHLFARKAKEAIDKTDKSKPMFLYLAFQSVHSPMEVPDSYVKPFETISDRNRRLYGGMVAAMDEAVKNITDHLKSSGLWNDTILIFSADNGGQTLSGGNNWPLRGRKLTLWEGGVKGVGFVHGQALNVPNPNNKPNLEMLHVSDWFPTIMGAAECPFVEGTQPQDGFNQWQTIAKYAKSKRSEILHNIDPLFTPLFTKTEFKGETVRMGFDTKVHAGIRSGEWKLLTGEQGDDRWIKPPEWTQNGSSSLQYEDPEHPGYSVHSTNLVQLYNIASDPYERVEVAALYPEIVDNLLVKLAQYNATAVPVRFPPNDPLGNPKYNGDFWGPWVK